MNINDVIPELLPGARKFARSALDAHATGDDEVFLLHAGVSIERLAKATLAHRNPFLLLEMRGSEDALFQFAGIEEGKKVRTIGAGQAIARLRRVDILPPKDTELDELIELRNGVAHLAGDHDSAFDALTVFARTSNQLLHSMQEVPSFVLEHLA